MNVIELFPVRSGRSHAAGHLRDQAASCRRLASVARTQRGALALATVADQFDADARRIDPPGFPPVDPARSGYRASNVIDALAAGRWAAR